MLHVIIIITIYSHYLLQLYQLTVYHDVMTWPAMLLGFVLLALSLPGIWKKTILGHLQSILMKLSTSNHFVNTGMVCVEDFCQVQYLLRFTYSCMLNCFSCITSSKIASTIPMSNRRMVLAPVHDGGTIGSTRPRYLLPYTSPKTLGHFKEPAGT